MERKTLAAALNEVPDGALFIVGKPETIGLVIDARKSLGRGPINIAVIWHPNNISELEQILVAQPIPTYIEPNYTEAVGEKLADTVIQCVAVHMERIRRGQEIVNDPDSRLMKLAKQGIYLLAATQDEMVPHIMAAILMGVEIDTEQRLGIRYDKPVDITEAAKRALAAALDVEPSPDSVGVIASALMLAEKRGEERGAEMARAQFRRAH